MLINLTDDEFETLRSLFDDYGSDCPCTDSEKLQALGEKLGIVEPVPPPTEEELRRREEFCNSPYGRLMSELFKQSNEFMALTAAEAMKDNAFMRGTQWPKGKIGTTLRVRLPSNYVVTNGPPLNIKKD